MRTRASGRCRMAAVVGVVASAGALAAGCSSSSRAGSPSSGGKLSLAGVAFNPTDPYWASMKCGAQSEARKLGVDIHWAAAPNADVATVLSTLNSATVNKPDGVVLGPSSPTAFVAPVQGLMRRGVPVVINDSPLSRPVGMRNVLSDNAAGARALVSAISKAVGPHGTLGIVAYAAGSVGDEQRYRDLLSRLHTAQPGAKVLPLQYTNADSSKSAQVTEAMIHGNADLKAIYATNGPQAIGAASGIQAAHAAGKVKLYAFDATPQQVRGVKDGTYAGIVGQSPYLEGTTAVRQLVGYLKAHRSGGAVTPQSPYTVHTRVKLLDKSNISQPSSKPFQYRTSC